MREWLKTLRLKNKYTMKDMSQKLGISESYYCAIENGERQKKMDMMVASSLATIFNIPISKIVSYENTTTDEKEAG